MDNIINHPLNTIEDLDPLLERIGDASCVMLGESSHGTHEYYTWRAAITKRLIAEKGFNLIALEGDWPDCYRINRYIKGYDYLDSTPEEVLANFKRWPTWMWGNWEMAALVNWLKDFNGRRQAHQQIGFYGLDVYSLWESMEVMIEYLDKNDPASAALAREAMECFEPYGRNEQTYALAQDKVGKGCREPLVKLLREVNSKAHTYDHDPEAPLNASQNAYVALHAEAYYSQMAGFGNSTWNLRDTHMMQTLQRLMNFHGENSKVIVWGHNAHIGDARYTNMKHANMTNIGQLAREQLGEKKCVLVGMGTYSGSVLAGDYWGSTPKVLPVPEAIEGSLEQQLHSESASNRLILFDPTKKKRFDSPVPHRGIGVVYDPERERYGNYVPTLFDARYDAFIYFDHTTAIHPLNNTVEQNSVPNTYPFLV